MEEYCGKTANTTAMHGYYRNVGDMRRHTTRIRQEYCRNTAGILHMNTAHEYCRNAARILQEGCNNTRCMLQEYCRNIIASRILQEYYWNIERISQECYTQDCCKITAGVLQE